MKKGLFSWMHEERVNELPNPRIFTDVIMLRDFSSFEIKDTDTEEEKTKKLEGREEAMACLELYTEVMVPAVAGKKLFHAAIRHFEPMTTAKLPPVAGLEQLRITASTEAMTVLAYLNNYTKWNSIYRYKKKHRGSSNLPRYSSKFPDENLEFKEEFSAGPVETNPEWGGWNDAGRKLYVKLQAKIQKSRADNKDRHVRLDRECVARLYEKYKDMHHESDRPAKKSKSNAPTNREDDADFQFLMEV